MVCLGPLCLCFPAGTLVTTKDGVKKIEDLKPHDKVLTAKGKNAMTNKWTKFYTWAHRETNQIAEYVRLKVSNGKELFISSDHLIFVHGESGRVAKKAGQICAGDALYHFDENGNRELLTVVEISAMKRTGVYAPFTMTGDFLANGFLVGCYANVENFELAHIAVAPLRAWYHVFNQSGKKMGDNRNGIHNYAQKLVKIRDLLPKAVQKWAN